MLVKGATGNKVNYLLLLTYKVYRTRLWKSLNADVRRCFEQGNWLAGGCAPSQLEGSLDFLERILT